MKEARDKIKVTIYTPIGKIKGTMHKMTGGRLLDLINFAQKDFLAITDVEIYDTNTNQLLDEAPFIALHRDNIIGVKEEQ